MNYIQTVKALSPFQKVRFVHDYVLQEHVEQGILGKVQMMILRYFRTIASRTLFLNSNYILLESWEKYWHT